MDHAGAQTWLDRYVAAWLSYDADEIRALFSEDIAYRYHPYDEPIVGREPVVARPDSRYRRRTVSLADTPRFPPPHLPVTR